MPINRQRIITGDCVEVLRGLPEQSVHAVITSPPYWGLRTYLKDDQEGKEHELGSESTLDEYLTAMVGVFHEVKRVLRDDGLVFLNIGDRMGAVEPMGIPGECVRALRADGWLLVREVIWCKPDANLDTSERRPRMNWEPVFLMAKTPRWYWDAHALPSRLNRAVWSIATANFRGAHFAVFPEELVRRCLAFGTSERGCCPVCGAPWRRVVEKDRVATRPARDNVSDDTGKANRDEQRHVTQVRTLWWEVVCEHFDPEKTNPLRGVPFLEPVPCTVLDPFAGSGTVGVVCSSLGRDFVGIELNPEYAKLARQRIANPHPEPEVPECAGQMDLHG